MSLSLLTQKNISDRQIRTTNDLLQAGLISADEFADIAAVAKDYDISITPDMARLIEEKGDPIALQFVPDVREAVILPQEKNDAISDYPKSPLKALVHRYPNRVLLKPTNVCAVYCRFCFRRDMVGPDGDTITQQDMEDALVYIAARPEISEVIFSGGDPLMLSPKRIKAYLQTLDAIPHVRWVRFHSRIPVVAPARITDELLDAFTISKPVMLAIHTNHAREITPQVTEVLSRLTKAGVMLLGQSVLLRGINDNIEALAELMETLMQHRVKPYYLHHPNLVTTGTSHFRISFETGMALMNQLRERVSGVCVPQYTLEIPSGFIKVAITPHSVRPIANKPGHYILRDTSGREFEYSDALS